MSKKQKETFLVNKNDEFVIDIIDIGSDGEGIGKVYPEGAVGYTLFVKDALIGDTIKVKVIKTKKNYGYGRLMEIVKPSPHRV